MILSQEDQQYDLRTILINAQKSTYIKFSFFPCWHVDQATVCFVKKKQKKTNSKRFMQTQLDSAFQKGTQLFNIFNSTFILQRPTLTF